MRKSLDSPLRQRRAAEGFGERKWHTVAFFQDVNCGRGGRQDWRNEAGVRKSREEAAVRVKDEEGSN